jgi:schlafen family protein
MGRTLLSDAFDLAFEVGSRPAIGYSDRMISKRLEEIGEADLDLLVANSVVEGKTIEYKKVLPGNSDGEKKEFLADVSSFANTTGGDLIFGIDEAQGVPTAIPGLVVSDPDAEVLRLDSIINDGLEPRIRFGSGVVRRGAAPSVLIVKIERSWIGPHRVVFKGHNKFYARNSAGKYQMDVSELRSAFTLASSVTERVREFREHRIVKLHDNKTPVTLVAGNRRTILHSIPLESFSRSVQYDVLKYSQPLESVKFPPVTVGNWCTRINLEGLVTYSGVENGSMSYTQLFRNGTMEAVEAYWLSANGEARTIPYLALERGLLQYLGKLLEVQKEIGVNPPVVVALTLTGTRGLGMAPDMRSFERGYVIAEDNLVLPEVVVESFSESPSKILKPLFDLVWNACGFAKSKNFDDQGNWIGR